MHPTNQIVGKFNNRNRIWYCKKKTIFPVKLTVPVLYYKSSLNMGSTIVRHLQPSCKCMSPKLCSQLHYGGVYTSIIKLSEDKVQIRCEIQAIRPVHWFTLIWWNHNEETRPWIWLRRWILWKQPLIKHQLLNVSTENRYRHVLKIHVNVPWSS